MPVDTEKLRGLSPNLERFLEFERDIEGSIRQEVKKMRAAQSQ